MDLSRTIWRTSARRHFRLRMFLALLMAVSVVAGFLAAPTIARAADTVTFSDQNLKAAVVEALGKPVGYEPTTTDMLDLTRLDIYNKGITSLVGLETALNLTWLDAGLNPDLTDITPITGLPALGELKINATGVTDLGPLGGMTALKKLDLGGIPATDLSPVGALTGLTSLVISETNPGDLSFLSLLANVTFLAMDSANAVDIRPLSGMTSLQKLWAEYNKISDLTPLESLVTLSEVHLTENLITDLGSLVENHAAGGFDGGRIYVPCNYLDLDPGSDDMEDIQTLLDGGVAVDYSDQYVTPPPIIFFPDPNLEAVVRAELCKPTGGITPADLETLERLDAVERGVFSLSGLEWAPNLASLNVSGNVITDLWPLQGQGALVTLDISGNPLSNIIEIASLSSLTTLYASETNVTSLACLVGMAGLRTLDIGGSDSVSDFAPIATLTGLQDLQLWGCALSDISFLTTLSSLERLSLAHNAIRDVSPLTGLASLAVLDLHENRLTDIHPLTGNTGLGTGDLVDLSLNYLDLDPGSAAMADIAALRAAGATVQCDPQNSVVFVDPNLEAAVREKLACPTEAISPADMERLSDLDARGDGVADLTGLEWAVNLDTLYLADDPVTDLAPIGALPLVILDLSGTLVSDLGPLEGMGTLDELYLRGVPATDFSPVGTLTGLKLLSLESTSPVSFDFLSSLTSLTNLDASSTGMADLAPLERLTGLAELDLYGNEIRDIGPLVVNCRNLGLGAGDYIDLRNNYLDLTAGGAATTDIQTLVAAGATVLYNPQRVPPPEFVTFGDANLEAAVLEALGKSPGSTVTPAELATLTELRATSAGIGSLVGLEWATGLQLLDVGGNFISDLSPLGGLPALSDLSICGNPVTSISVARDLPSLQSLTMWGTLVSDISPLEGNTSLVHLDVGNCPIADFGCVGTLTGLRSLFLYGDNLDDISFLAPLTGLERLALDDNDLSNVSALANLHSLTDLTLSGNNLVDISPLVTNAEAGGLGSGDKVDLSNNYLDLAPGTPAATQVARLIELGVSVTADSQRRPPTVTFTDPGLEAAVRDALGKPVGYITEAEVLGLTTLSASGRSIASLSGLEYADNLVTLDLSHNNLASLSELSGLVSLQSLDLHANPAVDLAPLLANHHADGFGPGDTIDLREMDLDLMPGSPARTVIDHLLDALVVVQHDPFPVIVAFADPALETAVAAALGDTPGHITPGDMEKLRELDISNRGITDLGGLEYAVNLTVLNAMDNSIDDLGPLAGLPALAELDVSGNPITDISVALTLPSLGSLIMANTLVSDISPLAEVAGLCQLNVGHCPITNFSVIGALHGLELLHIRENRISSISFLATIPDLQVLNASDNLISDLGPLSGLASLREVYLANNQITDLDALVANPGIGSGDYVDLRGNFLNIAEGSHDCGDIAVLTAAGAAVDYDPQRTAGLTVSRSTLGLVEGGEASSYDVGLTQAPTADVTVTLTVVSVAPLGGPLGDPSDAVSLSQTTLVFTAGPGGNWAIPRTVTVSAIGDGLVGGSTTLYIAHTLASADAKYNAIAAPTVTVDILDDATPEVGLAETDDSTDVAEGSASDTYTVFLLAEPRDAVTVTIGPSQPAESGQVTVNGGDTATLTFTGGPGGNWNVPQTVTVAAVDDPLVEGPHHVTLVHRATGSGYEAAAMCALRVNIADNDTLAAPKGLKAASLDTDTTAGVTLTWQVPAGGVPEGYEIWVSATSKGPFVLAKEVTSWEGQDAGAPPNTTVTQADFTSPFLLDGGKKYYFKVTAYFTSDTGGRTSSAPSSVVTVTAGPLPPSAVSSLKARTSMRGVRLMWLPPKLSKTAGAAHGYVVWISTSSKFETYTECELANGEWSGTVPNLEFTELAPGVPLVPGAKYCFKVFAYAEHPLVEGRKILSKAASANVFAGPPAPGDPKAYGAASLRGAPSNAGIVLTISQPSTGTVPDAYRLERLTNPDAPLDPASWTVMDVGLAWTGPTQTRVVPATELAGPDGSPYVRDGKTKYTFRVWALYDCGEAEMTPSAKAVMGSSVAGPLPKPPSSVRAKVDPLGGLALTWKAPTGEAPDGYRIVVSTLTTFAEGATATILVDGSTLGCLLTNDDVGALPGLVAGAKLYIRIYTQVNDPLGSEAKIESSKPATATAKWPAV